nr:transcription factor bHLH93-like [Ipomoea batatas]
MELSPPGFYSLEELIDHGYAAHFSAPPQDVEDFGVFGQIGNLESDGFSGLRSCGCVEVKMEQGNNGGGGEKKSKSKKVEGQPSKNLMAERRRRKRLNDRLSMLRSIMDRTSILGDTIDYMKELLEKIHQLREDTMEEDDKNHIIKSLAPNTRELKSNEAIVRNPPKFDVERRNVDTRIEICCATKPGLLLSTVSTIEALGLDIHQCVISCFNDFSFQATCAEAKTISLYPFSIELTSIQSLGTLFSKLPFSAILLDRLRGVKSSTWLISIEDLRDLGYEFEEITEPLVIAFAFFGTSFEHSNRLINLEDLRGPVLESPGITESLDFSVVLPEASLCFLFKEILRLELRGVESAFGTLIALGSISGVTGCSKSC